MTRKGGSCGMEMSTRSQLLRQSIVGRDGRIEDDDMAGINHRIGIKRGNVGVHAPTDGFTTPVPRFVIYRDDL